MRALARKTITSTVGVSRRVAGGARKLLQVFCVGAVLVAAMGTLLGDAGKILLGRYWPLQASEKQARSDADSGASRVEMQKPLVAPLPVPELASASEAKSAGGPVPTKKAVELARLEAPPGWSCSIPPEQGLDVVAVIRCGDSEYQLDSGDGLYWKLARQEQGRTELVLCMDQGRVPWGFGFGVKRDGRFFAGLTVNGVAKAHYTFAHTPGAVRHMLLDVAVP